MGYLMMRESIPGVGWGTWLWERIVRTHFDDRVPILAHVMEENC